MSTEISWWVSLLWLWRKGISKPCNELVREFHFKNFFEPKTKGYQGARFCPRKAAAASGISGKQSSWSSNKERMNYESNIEQEKQYPESRNKHHQQHKNAKKRTPWQSRCRISPCSFSFLILFSAAYMLFADVWVSLVLFGSLRFPSVPFGSLRFNGKSNRPLPRLSSRASEAQAATDAVLCSQPRVALMAWRRRTKEPFEVNINLKNLKIIAIICTYAWMYIFL